MVKLFFSYSHKDEDLRNELEKHLSILKRQSIIDIWHDRRIQAGSEFDKSISTELASADIILLLVSSDFLASNYCYDIEIKRAMQRHENGEAKIIPVILRPCNWYNEPYGKLLATTTDGQAITKYANQDEAFLDVVQSIEKVAKSLTSSSKQSSPLDVTRNAKRFTSSLPRSSNLRVKKPFTQHDKDEFVEQAFEFIAKFFEGSLIELTIRNTHLDTKFRRIDANKFTAVIYQEGQSVSECAISLGGLFDNGISYSQSISSHGNGFNESLSVQEDDHNLYLKPLMNMGYSRQKGNNRLSQQGAAEYYWSTLIDPLQR